MNQMQQDASLDIAVIGAGISGMAAAWLLAGRHRVTLYEAERRLGGHSHTVDAPTALGAVPVDMGFIVYNEANYPNLTALFRHLEVPTRPSDMSFAVSLDGGTNAMTFAPATPLGLGLLYTITITTGAKDLGGQPLAADYSWAFTTATCSLTPVNLRSAAGFAVLGGSTVTSGGSTLIAGDLGVSPGTAITGFPPGTVVGAQHPGDPTAAQGIADLVTAYNDAKGRTLCAVTLAGNLGGLTLTPGLYTSTSSLAISAGDLTLDAQEDRDAVFLFQTASTLTTTVGRQVVLINGAKASNVFWQVGTSATFGTSSAFDGTIMADQTITLNSGATLNGRALAHIGAVNLASNTVVKPPQ